MHDPLEIYRSAHSNTVAFDLPAFGKLLITGKDRGAFLQNFTTNDVLKPGPGSGCETFVTTAQAKIVGWLRLAISEDAIHANLDPGSIAQVMAHLQKYVIAEDVAFEDRTDRDSLWHVCGEKVGELFQKSGVDIAALKSWQQADLNLEKQLIRLQRCNFLGLPGVFLFSEWNQQEAVQSWLSNQGIPLATAENAAWDMLRIEAGTPRYGVDFDESNLPQESNRTEQAISFTKGCYTGQETVARIRAYGHVNRLLVGIRWESPIQDPHAAIASCGQWQSGKLMANGKEVGVIKSVIYSPRAQTLLAMAMLRREHIAPGTKLEAQAKNGEIQPVQVVSFPGS